MFNETTYPATWPGHEVYRSLFDLVGPSGLLLIAFALCAAVACAALLRIWRDVRNRHADKCPWKKDGKQSDGTMTRWVCTRCKSISFSDGKEPPITCRAYEPRSKTL